MINDQCKDERKSSTLLLLVGLLWCGLCLTSCIGSFVVWGDWDGWLMREVTCTWRAAKAENRMSKKCSEQKGDEPNEQKAKQRNAKAAEEARQQKMQKMQEQQKNKKEQKEWDMQEQREHVPVTCSYTTCAAKQIRLRNPKCQNIFDKSIEPNYCTTQSSNASKTDAGSSHGISPEWYHSITGESADTKEG